MTKILMTELKNKNSIITKVRETRLFLKIIGNFILWWLKENGPKGVAL